MKKLAAALALATFCALPATAQKADSVPAITLAPRRETTPASLRLASELLRVTRTEESVFRGMELGMRQGAGEDPDPKILSIVRGVFQQHLKWADVEPGIATVYAQLFTDDELRAMIAFYQTPAGRRMSELTADVALSTQQVLAPHLQRVMEEIIRRAQDMPTVPPAASGSR